MEHTAISALRATAIDGRAHNVFYRLEQLEKLHRSLVRESLALLEAIATDSGNTASDARIEFVLTAHTVKEQYARLDPKIELRNEYAIANGENADTLRFENNSKALPGILRRVISELDHDAVCIVQDSTKDLAFPDSTLQVLQNEHNSQPRLSLISTATRAIAVINRDAEFDEAAKYLINAGFAFRGRSPYAPDLVLVNEFAKKDFLHALVRQSISASAESEQVNISPGKGRLEGQSLKQLITQYQDDRGAKLISQNVNGAIFEISRRSTSILNDKVTSPLLLVQSFTSMDDAIDLANNHEAPLLAAYHFGSPRAAKYLSQFIPAQVTFVNHVPFQILVGPAFPLDHPVDPQTRYPAKLFTRPSPTFTAAKNKAELIVHISSAEKTDEREAALHEAFDEATASIQLKKRTKQSTTSFGFFEQAFGEHRN
ncbi:MAG: hypothetical protein MMC23_005698 [Stictis urceolatum]|nr:hypothetical protein [Stictis urceolata]